MKRLQLLYLLMILFVAACNEDMPYDAPGIFNEYPKPVPTVMPGWGHDENYNYWNYYDYRSYTTIGFRVQIEYPNQNGQWCVYWSDRPKVGPENGTKIDLSDPFLGKRTEEIRLADLRPGTTYYYNVYYMDENGDTYCGEEQEQTTYGLSGYILLTGWTTSYNKAKVGIGIDNCDPNLTRCCMWMSDHQDCPMEEGTILANDTLKNLPWGDYYYSYTLTQEIEGMEMGKTYYLNGYMDCNGAVVAADNQQFTMCDLGVELYSSDWNDEITATAFTARWYVTWSGGKLPEEDLDFDYHMWVGTSPDVMNDPQARYLPKEQLQLAKEEYRWVVTIRFTDMEPATKYYIRGEVSCQGKNYLTREDSRRTNNELTVLEGQDKATIYLNDGRHFDVVLVKAGTFMMGATSEQEAYASDSEKPVHEVTITQDYYIATCETTSELYEGFCYGNQWSGQQPAADIDHQGMEYFCKRLSEEIGYKVDLPTEAEWEYAARGGHLAGEQTLFAGSNNYGEVAADRQKYYTHGPRAVGSKQPNVLGLYDMTGNVWEACRDKYEADYYSNSPSVDPENPNDNYTSIGYVVRGGSCMPGEEDSAGRVSSRAELRNDRWESSDPFVGFRIVIRP